MGPDLTLGDVGLYLLVAAGCLTITAIVAVITYNIKSRR
jgi:uncharacterized iron-regulated membrane protein